MIHNARLLSFRNFTYTVLQKEAGLLVPIEAGTDIPFDVKRIYYIYGVDTQTRRGFHSHQKLEQVMICIHGSVKISLKTPVDGEEVFLLDSADEGLYVGPMVWREMFDFSPDAVLLVLASDHYAESDYFRDYATYQQAAYRYFSQEVNKP